MRSHVLPLDTGYILQSQWNLHTFSTEDQSLQAYLVISVTSYNLLTMQFPHYHEKFNFQGVNFLPHNFS